MAVLDRFLAWGGRAFTVHTRYQRVAYVPICYLFLWSAALRIAFTDSLPPIQFEALLSTYGENVWAATALISPPLALLAWWLITHVTWKRSALAGLWLRFGADLGMLASVLVYHVVAVWTATAPQREDTLYSRYAVASIMAFLAVVLLRDVWSLIMVERIAYGIRRD